MMQLYGSWLPYVLCECVCLVVLSEEFEQAMSIGLNLSNDYSWEFFAVTWLGKWSEMVVDWFGLVTFFAWVQMMEGYLCIVPRWPDDGAGGWCNCIAFDAEVCLLAPVVCSYCQLRVLTDFVHFRSILGWSNIWLLPVVYSDSVVSGPSFGLNIPRWCRNRSASLLI